MKEYAIKVVTPVSTLIGDPNKDKLQVHAGLCIAVAVAPDSATYSMVVREVSEWEEV